MSRAMAAAGVGLAILFGINTAYTTLQPELERQREERQGHVPEQHDEDKDRAISRAIVSDFKEAKEQALDTRPTGPAWKLRRALFGGGNGGGEVEGRTVIGTAEKTEIKEETSKREG